MSDELTNYIAYWGCITNCSIFLVADRWGMAVTWLTVGVLIYVFRKVKFKGWPKE